MIVMCRRKLAIVREEEWYYWPRKITVEDRDIEDMAEVIGIRLKGREKENEVLQ